VFRIYILVLTSPTANGGLVLSNYGSLPLLAPWGIFRHCLKHHHAK